MRALRILLLVAALGLLAAPHAAAEAVATLDEVPVPALRSGAAQTHVTLLLEKPADLIGVTWIGTGEVEVRTAPPGGRFGPWTELHAEPYEGPDAGRGEDLVASAPRTVSKPLWSPRTVQVALRVAEGTVQAPRLVVVRSSSTARERSAAARPFDRITGPPRIRLRSEWNAAPAAADPWYGEDLRAVVVHHTDSGNSYSCGQVPAMLRAIQRFHIQTRGWNDIGYNFLIDRCGGVWEGRGGGITRPVGGAHTAGFNTNTAGVAFIGLHSGVPPTAAAQRSFVRLVSWRMDVAGRSPALRARLVAAENAEGFEDGQRITVRAVTGHRDLFPTECPGRYAHRRINPWRASAWRHGGPKVANVTKSVQVDPATGTVAGGRITAVANSSRDRWVVTLTDRVSGTIMRTFRRPPGPLQLELPAMPGGTSAQSLDVEIRSLRGASLRSRPWRAAIAGYGADPGFTLTTDPPATINQAGDAFERLTLGFTLTSRSRLTAELVDPATGAVVHTFEHAVLAGIAAERMRSYGVPLTIPDTASDVFTLRIGVLHDDPARSVEERSITLVRDP